MSSRAFQRFIAISFVAFLGLATLAIAAPREAKAEQITMSAQFRTALSPHGSWKQHKRWGEVWMPSDRPRDWRPYTVGRWVYTNDYGWYWRAADREAAWGDIVYHYGRWIFDADLGWAWVPGDIWGPAWVSWRRGEASEGQHRHVVGWAPLPPDDVVVDVRDEPRYWIFVPARAVAADIVADVVLPPQPALLRRTVIVHRTVVVRKGGATFAVSVGIKPDYVAFAYGRPIPSYSLRPHVLAGTMAPPDAVTVRVEQFREARQKAERVAGELRQVRKIEPSRSIAPPQPLDEGTPIRAEALPRAAQGAEVVSTPTQVRQMRSGPDAVAAQPEAGPAPKGTKQDQAQQPRGSEKSAAEGSSKDAMKAGRQPQENAEKDDRQTPESAQPRETGEDADRRPQKDATERRDGRLKKGAEKEESSRPQIDDAKDASRQPRKDAADDRQRSKRREADKDADMTKDASGDGGGPQNEADRSRRNEQSRKERADEREQHQPSDTSRSSRQERRHEAMEQRKRQVERQREPERQKSAAERDASQQRDAESGPARRDATTVGRSAPNRPRQAGESTRDGRK
jgi:hypothetical protein